MTDRREWCLLDKSKSMLRHGRQGRETRFIRQTVLDGSAVRLPRLLRTPPSDALYRHPDRHGVAVIAVAATSLRHSEVEALMRFRFAQYLELGFVDRHLAYSTKLRCEPRSGSALADIHVVAGVPETGEVLCTTVLRYPPPVAEDCSLGVLDRPLFPVERVHGAGVFNALPLLPSLAVQRIRELEVLVMNQHPEASRIHQARAMVEVGVALCGLVAGPLWSQVDAVIGESQEYAAEQNLDFFGMPSVSVYGTVPFLPNTSCLRPRYQNHVIHPYACLTSDIEAALPRAAAIDMALDLPGKQAILALLRLKQHHSEPALSTLSGQNRPTGPNALACEG